ncbi:MAG: transporter ATP-binding protein [Blastococcus sp.]|nr:transporter ATP-binding protein [Blastococcus sp.]
MNRPSIFRGVQDVQPVTDATAGGRPEDLSPDGGIALRDVCKEYVLADEQRVLALGGTTLDIAKGEFFSVVGPSGCGKSTLLMMLAGLRTPTSGTISIDGTIVDRPYTDAGIVFQRDALMEWRTVLANVTVQAEVRGTDRKAASRRAVELLRLVGLEDFVDAYPDELSGGMRQRVSIARAFVHDPSVLLMDEPFAAIDALTRETLADDLQRIWLASQKTVFFITHNIQEAVYLSDRVAIMSPRPGRLVEIVDIDLPRPRVPEVMETEEFFRLTQRVHRWFRSRERAFAEWEADQEGSR